MQSVLIVQLVRPIYRPKIDDGHGMVKQNDSTHSKQINISCSISIAQSFPTPMEEPKKVLKAKYLGSMEVQQATGMEVLNAAIETATNERNPDQWESVNVAVAPSMISIHSSEASNWVSHWPSMLKLNSSSLSLLYRMIDL